MIVARSIITGLFVLAAGADWTARASAGGPEHWAFKPVVRPAVPIFPGANNAVDAFVLATLRDKGLALSSPAERRVLIRRVYLDVLGLPPSPEVVERFVHDTAPDAYARLVDRVLASPHYGERWGRHWLDVVRFAETHGFETNTPRDNAWPYRDWVIRSFNEDTSYTQFILDQLAGDQLGADEATGFLVAGPWDEVKSPDVVLTANQRADELHDMVSVTGSAFLGLTIGCARCHDHKFDPIPQSDYYRIKAAFAGVQHGERKLRPADYERRLERAQELRKQLNHVERKLGDFEPLANMASNSTSANLRPAVHSRVNVDRFAPVEARFVRFTVEETTGLEPCIDELEIYGEKPHNIALAAAGARATASSVYPDSTLHRLEHVNDGLYGNAHSWISSETGKGWVQIELAELGRIDKVVWGRDREEKYRDRLATKYRIEVAIETNAWRVVAASKDRRAYTPERAWQPAYATNRLTVGEAERLEQLLAARKLLETRIKDLTRVRMAYAGTFKSPEPTYRLHRGDPMLSKEAVAPGALTQVANWLGIDARQEEPARRLALGRWIVDARNPLTARVMVNRLWQYHFGRGIVDTSSDFGLHGAAPTHPALLDWLAAEFVTQGWRTKAIHRLILLSATYQQSSQWSATAAQVDADNRLLWRYPSRRLEAEVIRDCVLSISGTMDLRMGGPGYHVFEPNNNYVRVYDPKQSFGPAEWRRMIYQFKPRMQQDATFGAFDCPDGGQIAPKRFSSTTPLQALNLLNSGFVLQQADYFASRLGREKTMAEQVRKAFALAFAREPDNAEMQASMDFVGEQGRQAFCRAIFNANEFLYIP